MKTPFEAAWRRALRVGLVVPGLALLSMTVAANADGPTSTIQIFDVDSVQREAVGGRNGCWEDAPMGATVFCTSPHPEHTGLTATAVLDRVPTSDTAIAYETMDLTATGGVDYVAANGTFTVPAGQLRASFHIDFIDDVLVEGPEEFVVKVTAPPGFDLEADHILVTILDEESISVSVADSSADEGHASGMPVTVTFSDWVFWDIGLRVVPTEGTAGPSDYIGSGVLAVKREPGTAFSSVTFGHALIDDSLDEPDETYTLTVSGYSYLSTDADSGTMTILDDDDPPSASIADAGGPEDSVGSLSFTVELDAASGKEVALDYATADGTATAGGDYAETTGTLTFAAGEVAKTISVPVLEDGLPEADETFTVTLSDAVNATIGSSTGTGTIRDDDPVSAALSIGDVEGLESSGALEFPVRLTGTGRAGTTVTVDYATADGTATAGGDYAETTGTLTFAAGEVRRTIPVPLLDDAVDEPDETFAVVLSNPANATIGDAEAEGRIRDDDETSSSISLTARPPRVSEGDGATPVEVTATLDGGVRTVATTVSVTVSGSGRADAVDYAATATAFDITIAAGATAGTGTFAVTPEDDEVDERDEVLDLAGTSDLPVTSTSVTLADDDQTSTEILLSAVPSTVSEGAGETAVEVTATLDAGGRTEETKVMVTVTGSGDPDAVDFTAVPDFTIMIAAGATSGRGTFSLIPEDDNVEESSETLTVDGTADLRVTGASVTITDNDVASDGIVLSASPARVFEDGGAVPVRVTASLNGAARRAATTVTVSVAGSGDPRAVDFQPVADFEISIAANAASGEGEFTLTPVDDGTAEADETLAVSGASDLPVTPTTVTLADRDDPSTRILLSAVPGRVSEGDGATPVTVTATLDRAWRQQATSVTVSVTGGGDPDASDFESVPDFSITIPANAASGTGTFTLTPEDDETVEADEQLTISGVSDLPVTPAAVTLADDDEASTRILLFLAVDPPRASEGDGEIRVTVTAAVDKGARPEESRIRVSVTGSGDPDAVDFAAVADFEIVIPANAPEGTGTFTVVPEDDLIVEADETLTVSGVADLPVTPATMELLDDDEASGRIVLSADPARVSEGDGPVAVTVTASLDRGPRQEATTVTVSVAGGGDPDAVDFAAVADFTITIAANAANGTATFTLTPEDDAEDEADETLAVTGESDLPVTPASVVLADDDEMTVSRVLSIADAQASEGAGEVRFAVTLDGPSAVEVTADYATADPAGSLDPVARAGIDYESAAGTLTFAPGEVSRTIGVSIIDDDLDEPDETFTLVLADLRGATLGRGSALGTILDDDEPPALSIAGASGPEDVGELVFSVTLMARALTEVTVNYATMDDTAIVGDDYGPVEGTLAFAPGETAKTIRVPVIDDALDEADEETFAVALSAPTGTTLDAGTATGTIRDDDEPPALSVSDAAGDEDVGALEFAVTLSAPSGIEVSFFYETADGTATAGSDYAAASGTLVFAPGEVSRTIRVAILDDALYEADEETFAVALSAPTGATLDAGTATGTIRDDDEPPALSVSDAAGDEDVGALEFAVTLSAPSGIEVSFFYETADGTATAGSDYAAASGTLVFAPGEVSRTIRVAILDDALYEADEETFELSLSALRNATAADDSATGTIRDNDLAPPTVAGDLPAALLCVGGAPYELDLAGYFDGKELRFSAVSSTPLVATAALDGSMLTVAPASEGESSVTVTATNEAGSISGSIGVRVVADPAELEAVESVLASIGRAVLTSVAESVRARFDSRSAIGEQSASTSVQRNRAQAIPSAVAVLGNRWPGPPMRGTGSVGWDGRGLFEPQVPGDDWFETMNRTYRRGMVPFSFSLDSAQSGSAGPAWGVWGRADAHRFESGIDGNSHDGTLTAVHLGADARVDDWLAGVSVSRSAAEADYRFERSVDACGGGGVGEGMVGAELTSVHPYAGRQVGRGSVWAALGAGGGEVSVERCETGQRNEADLSMRLAALGGRHPFAGGERMALSVVEEIGLLALKTGDASGPIGDRSVTVGQARLGLEASGVVPADCECSLSSFVRAFARGDWGDGATGAGLELAAGVRYRNHPRRLGIDAGIRALAVHSAEDAAERSANLTFSILPKADGTGWQASLAWRRGARNAGLDMMNGIAPWTAPSGSLPGAKRDWIAESRLGYGIALRRGSATPFVELDAGRSERGGARFGVRHEFGDRARGLVFEWRVEQSGFGSAGRRILLEALGRF